MSICEVQKNYPLKKRPIQIVDSQDEPEDLSFNKRIKVPNEEYEFQPSTPESIKKDDTDSNDSHIQIDDDDEPIDVSTTKEPLKGITPLPVPHVIYSPKAKHPELMPWTLSVPPFPYLGRDYPYPFVRRFAVNHMKTNATKSDDIRRECWTPNKAKAYHLLQPSSMDINRLRQFTYGLNNNFIKPSTDGTYPYPLPHYYGDQRNGVSASVTATPFQLPLSPASSTASYYSLDSPRRSESPVSSTSSQTENFSLSYPMTVLRDISTSPSSKNITKNYRTDGREKADRSISSHYKCPDCGKSYSTYSGMSKHQQFHCPAAEGNQAKKSFNCKNCEKVYTSLGALKMHIRTHTLPCKCDICGKAFSRPWLLQGHIRTHTGEKPFNCQFCHRAFADRSNLRAHLQTHSDVKKYSCKSCSKTFSRMSLLVKHAEGGCPGLQLNPMFGRKEGVPAY